MAGAVGVGQSWAGEGFTPNQDLWGDGKASNEDLEQASSEAGGEAFMNDWNLGGSIGGAAGPIGGIIGGIAGLVMGLIDAGVTKQATLARLSEEKEWRDAMEDELESMRDFQVHIERNLAALLHPLEQQYRTRAALFGARARAQGLTGAQALAGQILAEEQYRQTIGPSLPAVYQQAAQMSLQEQMAKLREIEVKYGIQLDRDRLVLQEQLMEGQARGQFLGGIAAGIGGVASLIGQVVDDRAAGSTAAGGATAGGAAAGKAANAPADDTFGDGSSFTDSGSNDLGKTANLAMME